METRDTLRQALACSSAQGFVPILRRLAGWLLFLPVLRWQATVNSLPHFGHQAFARDKILRLNCLMKDHSYCAGLDREPPLGHDIVGSSGRHGNYRDACFRSEEHTSELQSRGHLVCRLLLEKKNERGRSHLPVA